MIPNCKNYIFEVLKILPEINHDIIEKENHGLVGDLQLPNKSNNK